MALIHAEMTALEGVEVDSLGDDLQIGGTTPGNLTTLKSNKHIDLKGGDVILLNAYLEGLTGIKTEAEEALWTGKSNRPGFKTDESILFKANKFISIYDGIFTAGGDITVHSVEDDIRIRQENGLAPQFLANQRLSFLAERSVNLLAADLIGLEGIDVQATTGIIDVGSKETAPTLKTNKGITLIGKGEVAIKNALFKSLEDVKIESLDQGLVIGGYGEASAKITTNTLLTFIANRISFLNSHLSGFEGMTANAKGGLLQVGTYTTLSHFYSDKVLSFMGAGIKLLHAHIEGLEGVTLDAKGGLQVGVANQSSSIVLLSDKTLDLKGNGIDLFNATLGGRGGISLLANNGSIIVGTGTQEPQLDTQGDIVATSNNDIQLNRGIFNSKGDIRATSVGGAILVGQKDTLPLQLLASQRVLLSGTKVKLPYAQLIGLEGIDVQATIAGIDIGSVETTTVFKTNKVLTLTGTGKVGVKNGLLETQEGVTIESLSQGLVIGDYGAASAKITTNTVLTLIANHIFFLNSYLSGFEGITVDAKGGLLKVGNYTTLPHFYSDKTLTFKGNEIDLFQAEMLGLEGITLTAGNGTVTVGRDVLEPQLDTDGHLLITGQNDIFLASGDYKAKGNITVTTPKHPIQIGGETSTVAMKAGNQLSLQGSDVFIANGKLIGAKGLTAIALLDQLLLGTSSTKPILESDLFVHLTGQQAAWLTNVSVTSKGDITVNSSSIDTRDEQSSAQLTAHKTLIFKGDKIDLPEADLTGVEGITLEANNGPAYRGSRYFRAPIHESWRY